MMMKYLRFCPMLLVMAGIFFCSGQTGDSIHLPDFSGADKLAHCFAYAVLAATAVFAFSPGRKPATCAILAFAISAAYGAGDEWHQSFVVGRSASCADLLADCLGAALMTWAWLAFWRRTARCG
jgi:VanZ family protein